MRVADAWKITFELQGENTVSRPGRGFPVTGRRYKQPQVGVLNRWYNETLGPRPVWDGDLFVSSECPCGAFINYEVQRYKTNGHSEKSKKVYYLDRITRA